MASNNKIPLSVTLIPIVIVVTLLTLNTIILKNDSLNGSSQLILFIGGVVAVIIGKIYNIDFILPFNAIKNNLISVKISVIILLLVGALSASWMLSGIIPAMVYYGMQLLSADFFLPACLIICCIVSLSTGSSWTTSATVGIALISISKSFQISEAITAGTIISGAYFGDKISPISDTTNLAASLTNTPLFKHISYMLITTIPSIIITLILFAIINYNQPINYRSDLFHETSTLLKTYFQIHLYLFIAPLIILILSLKKVSPLVVLSSGVFIGILFYLFTKGLNENILKEFYLSLQHVIGITSIETNNTQINELFFSKGIIGMIPTIGLIISAMIFGGALEGIGALENITNALLKLTKTTFGLFLSTISSCLSINLTASDQYISIVLPAKMFKHSFKKHGLSSENLSRTIEDSGTVTSALIPWNTCGAYHSSVLGVATGEYFMYAFFNLISPISSLVVALFDFKINKIKQNN